MIVGIDLGTTNSEVAVSRNGQVTVLEENGSALLPSCVGVTPDGRLVVGAEARNQYILRPESTVRSIKRKMGSNETVTLAGKDYSPTEISAMILRALKDRAERVLGETVTQAVITVPAYFNDAQRQATRDAGILAGLDVKRIVNEPTAAALAYEAVGVGGASHILVYDYGGGTFDVSLVKMTGDVVEVVASHGDNQLGGDDIDALLLEHALGRLREQGEQGMPAPVAVNRLRMACERLKIDLSAAATATLAETGLPMADGTTRDLVFDLSRCEFEDIAGHFFRRTLDSVRTVLAQAAVFPSAIDEILLVGGTTRIPAIVDMLEAELGKRPRFSLHPDLAVAAGAGVMAARQAGEQRQRILVDITPYTFGTSCLGDVKGVYGPNLFVPIIKSGTPLPARRGQVFYTTVDEQITVQVRIFQGESGDARENVFVGEFLVKGLDDDAEQGSAILLNMHLDLDGILTVTAVEQHTGLTKSVVMKNTLRTLTPAELDASREKVNALFPEVPLEVMNSDDEMPVIDTESEFLDGDDGGDAADELESSAVPDDGLDPTLRGRIDACRERLDPVDRADLEAHLAALREAVKAVDDSAGKSAIEAIEDILFYVE